MRNLSWIRLTMRLCQWSKQHGFDVWLVNARDTRNLPGRKSDVQESQWLLKLHTYGLLRKSFRPTPEIRALRTCWRERAEYVQQAGVCMQRVQKALTEMNLQLTTVLSDLSGVTGMSIIRSIVGGERDGMRLAEFREPGCKSGIEPVPQTFVQLIQRQQRFGIQIRRETARARNGRNVRSCRALRADKAGCE